MEEEENRNVFVSTVPISHYDSAELYNLIETTQAEPVKRSVENLQVANKFKPTEKIYVAKKICKKKVKTVQQIRTEYEDYINEYLPSDLEKQHKYIYDKICRGSSREEHNIEFVRKLLKSSNPMLRSTWQMLSNINVEDNAYPQQYILCNGKDVVVNGSKGGPKKYLYNFTSIKSSKIQAYSNNTCKKRGLLNSSLNVNFKPGPLAKKEALDTSFQKFTIGKTALKPLPEVGLEITTTYGVPLNPHLYGFIQNSQAVDGVLTEDWIHFAASAVKINENEENAVSTFKLKYQNNQKRILMRENKISSQSCKNCENLQAYQTNYNISSKSAFEGNSTEDTIKSIIHDLITAVEVKLDQHSFVVDEDNIDTTEVTKNPNPIKDRTLKPNKELKKLDVTIIYMGDNSTGVEESECSKPYCTLGCICTSLQYKWNFKSHCSLAECMFSCKCNYKKYCEDVNDLSGLIDLDKKINVKLAKEEQKFHHTVVFTEGKGTVLSAKNRTTRITKKCEKYISCLSEKFNQEHKELFISVPNIDCSNVETWCMVHDLYRCFCKGKFLIKPTVVDLSVAESNETICEIENDLRLSIKDKEKEVDQIERHDERRDEMITKKLLENITQEEIIDVVTFEPLRRPNNISPTHSEYTTQSEGDDESQVSSSELDESLESCCRTRPYSRKKGDHEIEMFGNDGGCLGSTLTDTLQPSNKGQHSVLPSKKFAGWLERCYILLKNRMDEGKAIILEKPVPKRVSLFPWTALLKRYQTRSNFFLVNRSPPHRIIIAVDPNDGDFKNYTDINYLRVDELPSLPYYVRHLVTGTNLLNNFVILRGYHNCWQILGSVSKNNERTTPPMTPMNVFHSTTVPLENPKISSQLLELLRPSTEGITSGEKSSMKESLNFPDEIVSSNLPSLAQIPVMNSKLTTYTNDPIDSHLVPSNKKRKRSSFRLSRDKKSATSSHSKKLKTNLNTSHNTCEKLNNKSKHKPKHTKEHIGAHIKRTSAACNNTSGSSSVKLSEKIPHRSKRKPNLLTETKQRPKKIEEKKSEQPVSISGALADTNSHNSKWFVMTVENDFKQLQFYNKNVYVTYKTITSAIELARSSEQTVILPLSKMKTYNDSGPRFGIYAIPVKDRACVLIGPYEKYEDLCMKTVKELYSHVPNKSTRGVWLFTKKVDNSSVLENPLSYLPQYSNEETSNKTFNLSLPKDKRLEINESENVHRNLETNSGGIKRKIEETQNIEAIAKKVNKVEIVSQLKTSDPDALPTHLNLKQLDKVPHEQVHGGVALKTSVAIPKELPVKRVVKPITIKRSNGFYQLAFNKIVSLKPSGTDTDSSTSGLHNIVPIQSAQSVYSKPVITNISSLAQSTVKTPLKLSSILKSPGKTTQATTKTVASTSSNKGFFVLKPEEINNKAFNHPIHTHTNVILNEDTENGITTNTSEIVQTKFAYSNFVLDSVSTKNVNPFSSKGTIVEIEKSNGEEKTSEEKSDAEEKSSDEQHSSDSEVYVLSDDDDDSPLEASNVMITPTPSLEEEVTIECVNIPNLGCIRGRLNAMNEVSFQFPGFKYTDFYSEEEASVKINQVLARKVFVPKSLTLKWQVFRNQPNKLLTQEQLGPQFVVTKRGLVHRLKLSTTVAPNSQHSTYSTTDTERTSL